MICGRDNLFVSLVAKCTEQCELLNITGSGQPVLKLRDRRGENACTSRAEDVYDMYTYVAGIVNEIPSSQARFPQGFTRKDSISDCNCKKCSAQIADMRVQISELKFMIREMNITREKVENYNKCCKSCLCNVPYIVLIPYFSQALIRVVLWDSIILWDVVLSSGNGESLGKSS